MATPLFKERWVHLDLKGAPPLMSYWEQILPLIKRWGATGLLVEYEDTFPYHGSLQVLQNKTCYSAENVKRINELCEEMNLEVIPLVQTFGHLEFVLKHDAFKDCREHKDFSNCICPKHPESKTLLLDMINQVLDLHPRAKRLHLGADEVSHLAQCSRCCKTGAATLYCAHVRSIAQHVQSRNLRPIIWDDMLRALPPQLLDSKLGDVTDIMVWHYTAEVCITQAQLDLYRSLCSSGALWVASAFKGASSVDAIVTPITLHLQNTYSWVQKVLSWRQQEVVAGGVCLTGWSRFDHYSLLCELLPVALPSLALCLTVATHGSLDNAHHQALSTEMGFTSLIQLQVTSVPECKFPGSELFRLCHMLQSWNAALERIKADPRKVGWCSRSQLRSFFSAPHANWLRHEFVVLLNDLHRLESQLRVAFVSVYPATVFQEWTSSHIIPKLYYLQEELDLLSDALTKSITS